MTDIAGRPAPKPKPQKKMSQEKKDAYVGLLIGIVGVVIAIVIAYAITSIQDYVYNGSVMDRLDHIESKIDKLIERGQR